MPDQLIHPVSARVLDGAIVLTDAADKRTIIDMPNPEGAAFCAAALDNEFKRARRTG